MLKVQEKDVLQSGRNGLSTFSALTGEAMYKITYSVAFKLYLQLSYISCLV